MELERKNKKMWIPLYCIETSLLSLFILTWSNSADAYGSNMQRTPIGDKGPVSNEGWGWRDNSPVDKGMSGPAWPASGGSAIKGWDGGSAKPGRQQNPAKGAGGPIIMQQGWDQRRQGGQKGGSPSPGDPIGDHLKAILRGTPGVDFPNYNSIPRTEFDCRQQSSRGYYGDVEAQCQVFHICQPEGVKDSFLCPLGTLFNQRYFVCDWWFNVNCSDTPSYYKLNEQVYKDEPQAPTTPKPLTVLGMDKIVPPQKWEGSRGKSFDDWSSAAQMKLQGGWDNMDGKESWKRSDEGVSGGSSWSSAGNKLQKNSHPMTPQTKGDGKAWAAFNNIPREDLAKPTANEVKQTAQKKGNLPGFGARIKSLDNNLRSPKTMWKQSQNAAQQTARDTGVVGHVIPSSIGNRAKNVWFQNSNSFNENLQGDYLTSSTSVTQPQTYISPSEIKGVWEQESVTQKTTTSANGWKGNGGSHKGTVRKTIGNKSVPSSGQDGQYATIGNDDWSFWTSTEQNIDHKGEFGRMNNQVSWQMLELTTVGDESELVSTTVAPWTHKSSKRRRYADIVRMNTQDISGSRKLKNEKSSRISKDARGTQQVISTKAGQGQSFQVPSERRSNDVPKEIQNASSGRHELWNAKKDWNVNSITAKKVWH